MFFAFYSLLRALRSPRFNNLASIYAMFPRRFGAMLLAVMLLPSSLAAQRSATREAADVTALERWLRRQADSAGFSGVVPAQRGGPAVLSRGYAPPARRS